MKIQATLIVLGLAAMSACAPKLAVDTGAPTAWNDEGRTQVESIHVTLLPAWIDVNRIESLAAVLEDTLRDHGLVADVELYDRLALETSTQRASTLNRRDYDVYVTMSMTRSAQPTDYYRMAWFRTADYKKLDKFYEIKVGLRHSMDEAPVSQEEMYEENHEMVVQFMQQLSSRGLISPEATESKYD